MRRLVVVTALVLAFASAAVLAAGCLFRMPRDSGAYTFTCSDGECPPGTLCEEGVCVDLAGTDSGGGGGGGDAGDAGTDAGDATTTTTTTTTSAATATAGGAR